MQKNSSVQAYQRDSLMNALSQQSTINYAAIIEGFAEKGIEVDQIVPRENVFTFNAWKALGRSVKKGERGVAIVTFVKCKGKDQVAGGGADAAEGGNGYMRSVRTHVFHVSQTEPIQAVTH